MSDLEREKQKLQDLLDMGFIFEDEYQRRLAELTGNDEIIASTTKPTTRKQQEETSGYSNSYYSPSVSVAADPYSAPSISSDPYSSYNSYSSDPYSSSTHAYSSAVSKPVTTSSGGGDAAGKKPFQPVEPCDCSMIYCRCGLQIPQCLEEDHLQVCINPPWDAFKCPLACGSNFGSRGECADHLSTCPSYIVACRSAMGYFTMICHQTYPSWCGAELTRGDLSQHYDKTHFVHPTLGEQQTFLPVDCPVCHTEVGEAWKLGAHFDNECEEYTVLCQNWRQKEEYQWSYNRICADEIKRKHIDSHWTDLHYHDQECGVTQIPVRNMSCPLSYSCEERFDHEQMTKHIDRCSHYELLCPGCKEEVRSRADLDSHVSACRPPASPASREWMQMFSLFAPAN